MPKDIRSQLEQASLKARSEPLEGAQLAQEILGLARQRGEPALIQATLTVLGHNRFQQGEHALALEHFQEALELCNEQSGAELFLMLGASYANLGESEEAFDYYAKGLHLSRQGSNPKELAFALHNVGSGCRERRDFARAEAFIQESLELYSHLGDKAGEAMCRVTLGLVAQEQGKFTEALPLLGTALEVAEAARDVRQIILARLNLAWVNLNLQNLAAAEQGFGETLALARRIEGRHYQGWALGGLGQLQRVKGNSSEAIGYFEQALAVAQDLKLLKGQLLAHEAFYQTYESSGAFEQALAHYKSYHQLERRILSERAERNMQMVAVRLEADVAKREARQLSESNQKLQHQAAWLEQLSQEDSLTGLYNRRYLDRVFREAFSRCTALSLIVADIDEFKHINDTFSHSLGDTVLCQIAALLRENCRATDTVARYGGEEFVVVLPETPLELATEIAERIRVAVREFAWVKTHPTLTVTLSLGVAERQNLKTPEQLLSLADKRLYAAKHQGRNLVVNAS
jgi:diguanylate cyclase (GGDEF)-like protein